MNKQDQVSGRVLEEDLKILDEGNVTTPKGYTAGGLHCGLKRKRLDLGWIYSEVPAVTAGVYTTNIFQAAPLIVTQESIAVEDKIQAVIVNSANANACTGEQGLQDAYEMRRMAAEQLSIEKHHTAVISTGVIGELMPMDKLKTGIEAISVTGADVEADRFEQAILTTDTCTKHVAVQLEIDGELITIGGAAKGSGMIEPNMATMLGFLTTDANVDQRHLHHLLKQVTNTTFNMITVDGDTSTNDMVLAMANGKANHESLTPEHPEWNRFVKGFEWVCQELAKKIARDGEGATKLIEVQVEGAENDQTAQAVAKSIIGSSLVKSAVFGTDPNWGRIVCAIGYSGQRLDPNQVKVALGPITVVENGLPAVYEERDAQQVLEAEVVPIFVDLNQGQGEAVAWGCDLTYEYVRINATYRT